MPGQVDKFLNSIQGGPKISAEEQLRRAQAQSKSWTREQEAQARAQGFNSAQEAYDFSRQRQVEGVNHTTGKPKIDTEKVKNDVISWHPAVMLNKILEAFQGATGGK